ncbi:reverse transcriptase [Lasallia pustulata]|uniref:Reverse transcriptase n=1 Tax=Lasallia pustulata TaxID=136370 RepID=A0A1W5CTD5_9LECA|nr:reverse transcriptase [Lasallia pustulata]
MDDQKQTIARIQAENHKIGDEKDIPISYVGWLCVPKRAAGSMVVEFTDAEQANVAVQTGLIWDSKYKKTQLLTTVFGAELQGIVMATAMTATIKETQGQNLWALNIYIDNQAAIRASANPGRQSGQYLLKEIVQGIDRLRGAGIRVQIHWIPAHVGVPGNEEADIAAKTAAQGPRTYSRGVFSMLATCKQKLRKRVFRQWAKEWENGATGRTIFHLEKGPNSGVLTKHTGIRRPLRSLITQLRTGKIALVHYLHMIQRRDSPRCPCSQGIQTVQHIFTECPRTQDLREELLGRAHDIRRISKDSAVVKAAAILVLRGNLLGQFQDVTEASAIYRLRRSLQTILEQTVL